jgi:hypothetical protein
MNFDLYYAACRADDAFTTELVRVYGLRNASERRYQFAPHADTDCESARQLKLAADRDWLDEMREVKS